MFGRSIVKVLEAILNVFSILILVFGTIGGTIAYAQYADGGNEVEVVIGFVVSALISLLFVTLVFGFMYVQIEINKNLVALNAKADRIVNDRRSSG